MSPVRSTGCGFALILVISCATLRLPAEKRCAPSGIPNPATPNVADHNEGVTMHATTRHLTTLPALDLTWVRSALLGLATELEGGPAVGLVDAAVELAAVLEVATELVGELDVQISAGREEIAAIDAHRAGRELVTTERPALTRRVVPWQLRRQALAWLYRPYTADPEGLQALSEALDAAALQAHSEACRLHGADGVSVLVRRRLARIAQHALLDLRSHQDTLDRARRCLRNLETVRRALSGEAIRARPRPLVRRAPDPIRAAARAVVPYAAREAALNWLWQPHIEVAA